MAFKSGHYIVGGGHYNPNRPPHSMSGVGREMGPFNSGVIDDVCEVDCPETAIMVGTPEHYDVLLNAAIVLQRGMQEGCDKEQVNVVRSQLDKQFEQTRREFGSAFSQSAYAYLRDAFQRGIPITREQFRYQV